MFQSQDVSLICVLQHLRAMDSSDSPLVGYLVTSLMAKPFQSMYFFRSCIKLTLSPTGKYINPPQQWLIISFRFASFEIFLFSTTYLRWYTRNVQKVTGSAPDKLLQPPVYRRSQNWTRVLHHLTNCSQNNSQLLCDLLLSLINTWW